MLAYQNAKSKIVIPTHQGSRGHPIIIPSKYFAEVLNQFDGVGLRGVMDAHPEDILEVAIDDNAVLADIDYPADYQRHFKPSAPPN